MKFTLVVVAAFIASASAGVLPRQAGGTSSGKAPGAQFITGNCASDAECASGCCNAKTGLCAARAVATENNGPGCGFGGAAAAPAAAATSPAAAAAATTAAAAAGGSGKAPGTQFITGACANDGECASGCCNAKTALCAARAVAEENNGPGCGFGGAAAANPLAAASTSAAAAGAASTAAAASTGSGKAPGTQFITGPCGSDGDCASGCCNAKTALCAARLVAEEGAGCGFGGANAGADAGTANRRRSRLL